MNRKKKISKWIKPYYRRDGNLVRGHNRGVWKGKKIVSNDGIMSEWLNGSEKRGDSDFFILPKVERSIKEVLPDFVIKHRGGKYREGMLGYEIHDSEGNEVAFILVHDQFDGTYRIPLMKVIPDELKRKGLGKALLTQVCHDADLANKKIILTVAPSGKDVPLYGAGRLDAIERMKGYYKQFGFEKDLTRGFSNDMIRFPKKKPYIG